MPIVISPSWKLKNFKNTSSDKSIPKETRICGAIPNFFRNSFLPSRQFWDCGRWKSDSLWNFSIVGCQFTVNCLLGIYLVILLTHYWHGLLSSSVVRCITTACPPGRVSINGCLDRHDYNNTGANWNNYSGGHVLDAKCDERVIVLFNRNLPIRCHLFHGLLVWPLVCGNSMSPHIYGFEDPR